MSQRTFRFHVCDVFTDRRFGGNPLAVLTDARGLSDVELRTIAREFNLSETTFVLPPDDPRHTARVRIFTPGGELPFAGHPTVGTAYVLASLGVVPPSANDIVFEEGVGPVPVRIDRDGSRVTRCTLSVARLPQNGPPAPVRDALAAMLSLPARDVLEGAACWSCGVPYLVVPLASTDALARCRLDTARWSELLTGYTTQSVYPVTRLADDVWRVRMFAPNHGVPEDPATGSAAAALAGWLAARVAGASDTARVRLEQGIEMGRPSEIALEFRRDAKGAVSAVHVGGGAVMVSEGTLQV
jgi:trans-2,3-dihydro-3-hydroxyanthranilate isomerase